MSPKWEEVPHLTVTNRTGVLIERFTHLLLVQCQLKKLVFLLIFEHYNRYSRKKDVPNRDTYIIKQLTKVLTKACQIQMKLNWTELVKTIFKRSYYVCWRATPTLLEIEIMKKRIIKRFLVCWVANLHNKVMPLLSGEKLGSHSIWNLNPLKVTKKKGYILPKTPHWYFWSNLYPFQN